MFLLAEILLYDNLPYNNLPLTNRPVCSNRTKFDFNPQLTLPLFNKYVDLSHFHI